MSDGHPTSKRVQCAPHAGGRRTYTHMAYIPIFDGQLLGLRENSRASRICWHIIIDGEPLCERITPREIGRTAVYADIKGQHVCHRCHHEWSWRRMPHDTERVDMGYDTPCLVWTRGVDTDGHGKRGRGGKWEFTHRQAYEAAYGPIPEGWVVHHLCGTKTCVEPSHFEALSRADHCRLHRPGDYRVYA